MIGVKLYEIDYTLHEVLPLTMPRHRENHKKFAQRRLICSVLFEIYDLFIIIESSGIIFITFYRSANHSTAD